MMSGLLVLVDLDSVEAQWNKPQGEKAPKRSSGVDLDGVKAEGNKGRAKKQPASFMLPGSGGNGASAQDAPAATTDEHWGQQPQRIARVVCALNEDTVRRYRIEYSHLESFAQRLAVKFNASLEPTQGIELALVRGVPQAADVALFRLLKNAPAQDPLQYDRVVLATNDKGLVRRINKFLKVEAKGQWPYKVWGLEPPLIRQHLVAQAVPVTPSAPDRGWGSRVTTDAHVAHLQHHNLPTGVAGIKTLQRLADIVGQEQPGLLSQLSLTTTSVRGVARHVWNGNTLVAAPLEPFDQNDGVELRADGFPIPDGKVHSICRSSVEGAAWVEGVNAARQQFQGSVATRLPPSTFDSLNGDCRVQKGRLRDSEIHRFGGGHCFDQCCVNVEGWPGWLIFQIGHAPDQIPSAWWLRWEGADLEKLRTKSETRIQIPMQRGASSPQLRARLVADPQEQAQLVLRSAAVLHAKLKTTSRVTTGRFGVVLDPQTGKRHLALNLGQALSPGQPIAQWQYIDELETSELHLDRHPWIAKQAHLLRTLPILVVGRSDSDDA